MISASQILRENLEATSHNTNARQQAAIGGNKKVMPACEYRILSWFVCETKAFEYSAGGVILVESMIIRLTSILVLRETSNITFLAVGCYP